MRFSHVTPDDPRYFYSPKYARELTVILQLGKVASHFYSRVHQNVEKNRTIKVYPFIFGGGYASCKGMLVSDRQPNNHMIFIHGERG
jgi:hypothetical protein